MIKKLTNNMLFSFVFSALLISIHLYSMRDLQPATLIKGALLLLMGVSLNLVCRRFKIIGRKSHLTLVLFAILSSVLIPVLSIKALAAGFLWLIAVYLAFYSWEEQERAKYNLMYIGVFLGIGQTMDANSVLLFAPLFLMFFQNAVIKGQYYLLSIVYFVLILLTYTSVLFIIDRMDMMGQLVPELGLSLARFEMAHVRAFMPIIVILVLWHLTQLSNYPFRYPNRNININLLFLYQLIFAIALIVLTSSVSLLVLLTLPACILLSVAFVFKQENLLVSATLYGLIFSSVAMSIFFNYI